MSAPAIVGPGTPTLRIRGTPYPVLLPKPRDPRLQLAAVIVSLQILGQVTFAFQLSIAQILIALGTSALIEVGIAFFRQRVIMWPASALLTGNGVAFVLRVPGTQHGDWWSLRGGWIFAATAAVSILSKHVLRIGGRHVFNPSNLGLVVCFLVLGKDRADPLDFWWAPMSPWLALAFGIIVLGGFALLWRLRLLAIAVVFWLTFAAGIAILAASGHAMSARWHLGPITGAYFWWVLCSSPELLVFLFFMITDPKTIPSGRPARLAYAVGVGLVAALLVAPQRTEFGAKVGLLGALAIACLAQPLLARARGSVEIPRAVTAGRARVAAVALLCSAGFVALLVLAGIPARPGASSAALPSGVAGALPRVTTIASDTVSASIGRATSLRIARDVVADLRLQGEALRRRDRKAVAAAADGPWLNELWRRIDAARGAQIAVPAYLVESISLTLERRTGQGQPLVLATLAGTTQTSYYAGARARLVRRGDVAQFQQTFALDQKGGRFLLYQPRGAPGAAAPPASGATVASSRAGADGFRGVRLTDVARKVGVDFRQGSFRFGISSDPQAMMGGGVCWLDVNGDGWMDLFAVNSYADSDYGAYEQRGGLPHSSLFLNEHGRFVDVTRAAHAGVTARGTGCVAADFNGDGRTDIYVSAANFGALLWNNGDGTFTEGGHAARVDRYGFHTGAAAADVNGDGRIDLFVAGYTDTNGPIPGSDAGFPTNHIGVRDMLFLNEGNDANGHAVFRDVAAQAGIEKRHVDHGLGALFTDVNGDGRPDLYVANDEDPNRLYVNTPWPGGAAADPLHLGFRFVERGAAEGVADPNAGMGVASADFNGDGRADLFVTNSRGQPHAVYRGPRTPGGRFADARPDLASAFGSSFTGWGDSWVDLNRDGAPDLVLANGAIPVLNVARDAGPIQVLENLTAPGGAGRFVDESALVGLRGKGAPLVDGRGVAAADFDNDGNVDLAINSIGGRLILLRTTNTQGHWLEVSLGGMRPGAVVTAALPDGRTLVREVHAGSSYLSSEDPRVFFGLGAATRVSLLTVRFPDGRVRTVRDVAADRIVTLRP